MNRHLAEIPARQSRNRTGIGFLQEAAENAAD